MPTAPAFVHERAVYSWIAFALPPAAIFGHALAPGAQVWKGQDLGVLGTIGLVIVMTLLWIPFRTVDRPERLASAFFAVLALAWVVTLMRIQVDGSLFNLGAFAVPVILLALWTKPPSGADLRIGALVLGYGLAAAALLSIPLGILGVMPSGFDASDSAVCRTPILCDLTGGLDRWAGPFGSVNYAAPAGGLLLVLGLTQPRYHRWLLAGTGVIVLALSQGRSAVFGVFVAILVLVLWGRTVSAAPHRRAIRVVALVASAVASVLYVMAVDPTFNGRTPIWHDFLQLWSGSPLTGVGDSGISAYIAGREGLLTFSHAHSVLLDTLVRWGIVPELLALGAFALALVVTARGVSRIGPGPLAVVAFVIAAGLTETIHGWTYWSLYVAALTWAVLSTGARPAAQGEPAPSLS